MKNIKISVLILFFSFSNLSYSQGWGEAKYFSYLKDEKKISLKFNYDQLMIEDVWTVKSMWKTGQPGQLKTEKEFLLAKAEEHDKKIKGSGKKWLKDWEQNKKNKFEPRFEKFFNKGTKHRLLVNRFADTLKYTILINVKAMRLGGMGGCAFCDFEVLVFETAKPANILSKAVMDGVYDLNCMSVGDYFIIPALISGRFLSGSSKRVKDCYAQCGKDLGKEIRLSCRKKTSSFLRDDPIFID